MRLCQILIQSIRLLVTGHREDDGNEFFNIQLLSCYSVWEQEIYSKPKN